MAVRLGLGLAEFPFSSPRAFWRWIELCEAGGVDSLWQSDRLTGPQPFLESLSLMAALAGATERMRFGMSVLSIGFRDPLVLAKQCATIDFLSEGRFLPGMGIGSLTSPDWKSTGAPLKGRGERTDEALEVMTRLWRGETVDFEGRWFCYRGAAIRPLPVQQPLPLWMGGSSAAAVRRTARFADGWHAGVEGLGEVARTVAAIKAEARALGRVIEDDHFGAALAFRFGPADDPLLEARRAALRRAFPKRDAATTLIGGGPEDMLAHIADYVAIGVTKFILRPIAESDADLVRQTERLIAEVIPAAHQMKAPLPA
jgi:probable F420-dependent oxidoreductase